MIFSLQFTTDEKKEAIEALAANPSDENFEIQSQKYNTTIRNLKRWFNQGYVRKQGCGRKRVNPQAVAELEQWILTETKKGGRKITRDFIKSKALEIFNSDTFKASKMWMDKFLSEYDIKFKVQTILQEHGCLSKLQEVKFKQEQKSRREKESESLETKRLVKNESQEQIQTDLNVKQGLEEKVYVEDFFLDQDAINLFSDSYEIQSRQNQVELQQFSEQFIPKLTFLGDSYEDIYIGYYIQYFIMKFYLKENMMQCKCFDQMLQFIESFYIIMKYSLLIIFVLICITYTQQTPEQHLKKEIIKKIANYVGIELPHDLHLFCLPCKLMMKQVQKFSRNTLLTIIKKEYLALCPHFYNMPHCLGKSKQYHDEFAVHFIDNYLKPSNACQVLGACKVEHQPQTLKEYINEVMHDKLTKEQQQRWKEQAEALLINNKDYKVVQYTDLHIDTEYSEGADAFCNAPLCCRKEYGTPKDPNKGAQYWGTLASCDLPFRTVQNLLQFTKENIDPDFIIWTGDSIAHDVWQQFQSNQTIPTRIITEEIQKTMPTTQVYAMYGNHEAYPAEQYDMIGESTQWLRDETSEMWKQYLSQEAYYQLRRNGYYSQIDEKRNLKIIALNSQAYDYDNFFLMEGVTDPRGMLKWLIQELQDAESKNQFAIIIAHIPPGDISCNSQWADRFSVVIERFEHVVSGLFYGHTHSDQISHIRSRIDGRYIKTIYIAPSVTTFTRYNPSFRVFYFNGKTNQIIDFSQYRLDLAKANKEGQNAILNWNIAYNFLEYYGLQSSRIEDVQTLGYKMRHDEEILKKYIYSYATGSEVRYKQHLKDLKKLFLKKGTRNYFICGVETATYDDWFSCIGFIESLQDSAQIRYKIYESFYGKWLKD
ncbi:unnamed protein product [Paramecium pentaurelia]|uniref:HTH CENPB-type domain-containing protein n=1 Tax=Paramecium pentaurelia TaxID=43138 RepID=A0A8S1SLN8_9CILI|nr:unnamed protein product [Paramecium pentaurelia]